MDHDRKFKEKIVERIKSVRGRELPRFISFQACEELVKEIVQTFLTPAKICLTEVNEIITEILGKAAHQTLGHYRDLEVAVKVVLFPAICLLLLMLMSVSFRV